MVIGIAAGGTLGHILPGLIFAEYLEINHIDVIYILTNKDIVYEDLVKKHQIKKYYYLETYGLDKNIKHWYKNIVAYRRIKSILKENKVTSLVGFGGYISGISLFAAKSLKLKTFIHEQNSIMGRANKYMLLAVDKVFLSYEIDNVKKGLIVGNPIYDEAIKYCVYKNSDSKQILFTSGSLGSKVINDIACSYVLNNIDKASNIYIITGNKYYDDVYNKLKHTKCQIFASFYPLTKLLAKSNVVITRAGASTLEELAALGVKAIIVPSPNVTANHQYYNALSVIKNNFLCKMILEKDLTLDSLDNAIGELESIRVDGKQKENKSPVKTIFEEINKCLM